ncbi:MAG: carbohydrate binding family 9 domain-containing protein [Rhodothermales bacterium]|nr:carbohydrate binding family 9 domain-containing protein [Rhodothermales bacterium]MBO6778279.1 carbohydrate binding family 9 domain-containing protein [Rhodothermales bacterium]
MNRCYKLLSLGILALALALPTSAQTSRTAATPTLSDPGTFTPNVKPALTPQKTESRIIVDGDLSDPGWSSADRAYNFSETFPGDQSKPPVGIEVWTTYDANNIYFAFMIEDDPESIRVNMSDRDAIWQDDYVGVILDPYANNAWAYFIASNPIGIQGDTRILGGGNEDMGFDIIFQTDGKVTEKGYQVEMAVPFESLRFPQTDVQNWNINFWITHPRESRNTYSWAAIDRDDPCWLCQAGSIEGITGATPAGKLELLPAFTGSQAASLPSFDNPDSGLDNSRLTTDPSFGLKYRFNSNLIADVAVNPDFSQIESDAAQIDVNSTFALFFEERRPFFQEGSDLFDTPIQTVYTRSINNPSAAAKITGRSGNTSFSYVGGLDEDSPVILPFEERSQFVQGGESYSSLLRVKQNFGTNSHLGALVTDRRFTGTDGVGSTFAVDGNIRLSQSVSVVGQLAGSHTSEGMDDMLSEQAGNATFNGGEYTAAFDGESYSGWASSVQLQRNTRHMWSQVSFESYNPTFRAANGFVNQNNNKEVFGFTNYTFYRDSDKFIQRISPKAFGGYIWNFDGERKDEFAWVGVNMQMKGQTWFNTEILVFSNERFAGEDFRNMRRINLNLNSNFSQKLTAGFWMGYGHQISRNPSNPVLGMGTNLNVWSTFRPTSRLSVSPRLSYARLEDDATGDEIFSGYILRSRMNYQFSKRLFMRVITQYNDFAKRLEVDPLVTYKVNPFTAVYVGSTHDFLDFEQVQNAPQTGFYQTQRQFFFKLQYLFRMYCTPAPGERRHTCAES